MKGTGRLLNVNLHLPEKLISQLQDECEEFSFELEEYLSAVLISAANNKMDCCGGCFYERIDWSWMKKEGLCE